MFTVIIVVCLLKRMCMPSFVLIGCYFCRVFIEYTKFHLDWLLCHMAIYVPIVMYGLRLFIVVLGELQCLANCLHVSTIRFCYFTLSTPSSF